MNFEIGECEFRPALSHHYRIECDTLVIFHDLTIFLIESQNFRIKSHVDLQRFKSNLYITNLLAKMVQIAI